MRLEFCHRQLSSGFACRSLLRFCLSLPLTTPASAAAASSTATLSIARPFSRVELPSDWAPDSHPVLSWWRLRSAQRLQLFQSIGLAHFGRLRVASITTGPQWDEASVSVRLCGLSLNLQVKVRSGKAWRVPD
eukprot:scaffold129781_cov33-Tisochrysis_lutea.AAC.4